MRDHTFDLAIDQHRDLHITEERDIGITKSAEETLRQAVAVRGGHVVRAFLGDQMTPTAQQKMRGKLAQIYKQDPRIEGFRDLRVEEVNDNSVSVRIFLEQADEINITISA